jgi:NTE family protein
LWFVRSTSLLKRSNRSQGDMEIGGPMSVVTDLHPRKSPAKPTSQRSRAGIWEVKRVNLALQGGSAHGAFTWGVLDRLLEEPRIEVEGISATSAGAMNAAVMAHGLTIGGPKGAREALEVFWDGVARVTAPLGALQLFEVVSRFLSPYELNPFNYNPLRELLQFIAGSYSSSAR